MKRNEAVDKVVSLLRHHPIFIAEIEQVVKSGAINSEKVEFTLPIPFTYTRDVDTDYSNPIDTTYLLMQRFNIPREISIEVGSAILLLLFGNTDGRIPFSIYTVSEIYHKDFIDSGQIYIEIDADARKEDILAAWQESKNLRKVRNIDCSIEMPTYDKWGEVVWEKVLEGKKTKQILDEIGDAYKEDRGVNLVMVSDIYRIKSRYKALLKELAPLPKGY